MPTTKILVVEDERLIAYDIKQTLEELGYSVFEPIASAELALIQVATLRPDLVLMDIYLDGEMDGVEASAQIQSQFNIPVVFLTANADSATLDRIKAIQPFGYLLKPYNEKELSTTIAIALSRHQAEVEVREALTTAETQWAEAKAYHFQKSQYLATTAHELRNPLVVIQFATEMLQERGEQLSKVKQQKHFQRIQIATNDLNETLDRLLLLEQIEADKLPYEPAPLEVVGFCRDFVAALQIALGESYVFTFAAPIDRCLINLDAKLLSQLLNTLFANAINYSPEGSLIELTLTLQPEQITLQLRDPGIGIPPADCPHVFRAFYRATNVSQFSGSGLGLTIAQQCVNLHKGEIWIESTLGKGTAVFVSLPR
jgi:signal transduction histidine kinase